MDNLDNILSVNDISKPSDILFTKEDIKSLLNIQGNQKLYNLEIKETIKNCNDNNINVYDWFDN